MGKGEPGCVFVVLSWHRSYSTCIRLRPSDGLHVLNPPFRRLSVSKGSLSFLLVLQSILGIEEERRRKEPQKGQEYGCLES